MNTLNIDSKERRLLGCAHKSRRFVRSTVNGKQLHIVLACNHCHKHFETVHTIGAAQASPV